jgi:peptidoglycan/xylan/chitin deacetylase (PgdA/CDA1 family)
MTKVRQVALTFETGGDPAPAGAILDTLASAAAPATFFVDGSWAERNPSLLERIAQNGHELGTHGFHHQDWTTLDDGEVLADLKATEDVVNRLVGRSVKPWARPPYGAIDGRVGAVLESAGYRPLYRDAVDGAHWPGETDAASVEARACEAAEGDGIVTFHTNRWCTAEALVQVLSALAPERLVRLTELDRPPSSRVALHDDFAGVTVTPGYVRPNQGGGRWQSLNLVELGGAATRTPGVLRAAELETAACDLVIGSGTDPMPAVRREQDGYVLVLAGELRCDFGDEGEVGEIVARSGDMFLCPAGVSYCLGPTAGRRRYVASVWHPVAESDRGG